jgi:hypothetical protein
VSKKIKANRIYEKWKVDFVNMDKKRDSIRDNFDQLFYALYCATIPWDMAREIVDDAVAHHLPTPSTIKYVWNARKQHIKLPYKDWLDNWKDDIRNKALASFYEYFPLDEEPEVPPPLSQTKNTHSNNKKTQNQGLKTDDELNEEDFYQSSKLFTRDTPFLFDRSNNE